MSTEHEQWAQLAESPRFIRRPRHIATPEDAFTLLGFGLWRNQWKPQDEDQVRRSVDLDLAAFVRAKQGVLEALLSDHEHQKLLAFSLRQSATQHALLYSQPKLRESLLHVLLYSAKPQEGKPLWRTLLLMDSLALIRVSLNAQERFAEVLPPIRKREIRNSLAGELLRRMGEEKFLAIKSALMADYSPEQLDVLEAIVQGNPPQANFLQIDPLPEPD